MSQALIQLAREIRDAESALRLVRELLEQDRKVRVSSRVDDALGLIPDIEPLAQRLEAELERARRVAGPDSFKQVDQLLAAARAAMAAGEPS